MHTQLSGLGAMSNVLYFKSFFVNEFIRKVSV